MRRNILHDLLVVADGQLVAAIEVKSQVGSLGNNFNNRVEEALGNATDFWRAYSKGMFSVSSRPWLGYLFMLETSGEALRPTKVVQLPHFPIDSDFASRSYAQRYEEVCRRMVHERLYDAACFITSYSDTGALGHILNLRRNSVSKRSPDRCMHTLHPLRQSRRRTTRFPPM